METGFKRSLYTTEDLSFNLNLIPNDYNRITLGFSGSGFSNEIYLESGRVYDFNNKFIFSYQEDNQIRISGSIYSDQYNVFINNNPLCIGLHKNTGFIDYLYVKNVSGSSLNYTLAVNTPTPEYLIQDILQAPSISGQISGKIELISGHPFRVFSGNNQNVFDTGRRIVANNLFIENTGYYLLNYDSLNNGNNTIYTSFFTNFGKVDRAIDVFFDLNVIPITNLNITGLSELSPFDYGLSFGTVFGVGNFSNTPFLEITVSRNTGYSGMQQFLPANGLLYGEIHQIISGSGIITVTGTGFITGYNSVNNTNYTGSGILSGTREYFATGIYSDLVNTSGSGVVFMAGFWTGAIPGATTTNVTGFVSGYVSGDGFLYGQINTPITATGYFFAFNSSQSFTLNHSLLRKAKTGTGFFIEAATGRSTGIGLRTYNDTINFATGVISGYIYALINNGARLFDQILVSYPQIDPHVPQTSGGKMTTTGLFTGRYTKYITLNVGCDYVFDNLGSGVLGIPIVPDIFQNTFVPYSGFVAGQTGIPMNYVGGDTYSGYWSNLPINGDIYFNFIKSNNAPELIDVFVSGMNSGITKTIRIN